MVMQKGGVGVVPKPKQESGQQVRRKKFSFWLENWVENGVFQRDNENEDEWGGNTTYKLELESSATSAWLNLLLGGR